MPLYQFECSKCHKLTNVLVSKPFETDDELEGITERTVCSECGCANVEFVEFPGCDFELKGTGWYKDGYSG